MCNKGKRSEAERGQFPSWLELSMDIVHVRRGVVVRLMASLDCVRYGAGRRFLIKYWRVNPSCKRSEVTGTSTSIGKECTGMWRADGAP
jgi:RNase P/RNase MRP subunit POP5